MMIQLCQLVRVIYMFQRSFDGISSGSVDSQIVCSFGFELFKVYLVPIFLLMVPQATGRTASAAVPYKCISVLSKFGSTLYWKLFVRTARDVYRSAMDETNSVTAKSSK